MKFSVFDNDVESLAHWRRFTTSQGLEFHGFTDLTQLQVTLAGNSQVIVLDESLSEGDFAKSLVNYCQQYRQHLFVATAQKLSVQQTVQMIQHRAAWVFDKPLRPYLVEPALKSIVESATAVADKLDEFRRLQQLFDRLTEREKQVLDLILSGTPNKDAAEQLEISIRTVEARRAKVYQKTENDNVVGLVRTSQRLEQLRLRFTPLQSDSLNVLHYHLGHAAGQNQSQLENEKNRKNGDDLRYANG